MPTKAEKDRDDFNSIANAMSMEGRSGGARAEAMKKLSERPELARKSWGDQATLLLLAARCDDEEMLDFLLAQGASDLRAIDEDNYSALAFASMATDAGTALRMVTALLKHVVLDSWNPRTHGGLTDIMLAIRKGHVDVVESLARARIEAGQKPYLDVDSYGRNWLHCAVRSDNPGAMVRWTFGMPNAREMFAKKDCHGLTPRDCAKTDEALRELQAQESLWEKNALQEAIGGLSGKKAASPRL